MTVEGLRLFMWYRYTYALIYFNFVRLQLSLDEGWQHTLPCRAAAAVPRNKYSNYDVLDTGVCIVHTRIKHNIYWFITIYQIAVARTVGRTCSRKLLRTADRYDKISFSQDDFIRQEGYPVERHTVITSDGYNLTLHRIPYSKNEDPSAVTRKPAVLVQHGILCSSTDWVIAGQNNSLGEWRSRFYDHL